MTDSRGLYGLYGVLTSLLSKGFYDLAQQVKQIPTEVNYAITIFTGLLTIDFFVNVTRNKEPYTHRLFNHVVTHFKSI